MKLGFLHRKYSPVFPLAENFIPDSADSLESTGQVPDYLKAVAYTNSEAATRLAKLVRVVIFGGTLPPSLKLAMGSQITQQCQARYAQAHVQRLAKAVGGGDPRTALAVRYATDLTRDVHGVSDETFNAVNMRFNDAQVVELTMVTCFFNYFARLTNGLGLTPEPWLIGGSPQVPASNDNGLTIARVALASDAELAMAASIQERAKSNTNNSLGIGIANSQRAMIRVPDLYEAWMGGFGAQRTSGTTAPPPVVPRTTMLQVSLAVSLANGCRYCVLHQVQGLRRSASYLRSRKVIRCLTRMRKQQWTSLASSLKRQARSRKKIGKSCRNLSLALRPLKYSTRLAVLPL